MAESSTGRARGVNSSGTGFVFGTALEGPSIIFEYSSCRETLSVEWSTLLPIRHSSN